MYCQVCGAKNSEEQQYCHRCHNKLLILSGAFTAEDQASFDHDPDDQFSFDEHLLERISILEEVVKRTAETLRQSLGTLYKLEQKILVNNTGITTLRDLLERKSLIRREEWSEIWESRMDAQLLALEKRERFAAVREQVLNLYRGDERAEFKSFLDAAENAFLSFDMEGALVALESAFRLDQKNSELGFFLGETFFNEGEVGLALEYFQKVLRVRPEHYESLVYCGVLWHDQGESGKAEELLKRACALYEGAFLPAFSLGAVYASRGQLPQAILFLERAATLDEVAQAHYLLGSCYYEMGRVGPAIRHLRETVRLDPIFAEAYFLLGLACLDRRWYRKAHEAFAEAQRLSPRQFEYRDLVLFLTRREASSEVGLGEDAALWLERAERSLDLGTSRQALSHYRRAIASAPEDPALLVSYALACLELGRNQEIDPIVEKVLELEPDEWLRASAWATQAEALRTQGKYREGNRIARRLLEEGGSDHARALGCYEMACNLAEMGEDLDEALRLARKSLDLSPSELQRFPLAALGWVHYKRREYGQAVDCLSRSSEMGASAKTLTYLGMALLAAGQRQRARQVLSDARRLQGRSAFLETEILESLRDSPSLAVGSPTSFKKPNR